MAGHTRVCRGGHVRTTSASGARTSGSRRVHDAREGQHHDQDPRAATALPRRWRRASPAQPGSRATRPAPSGPRPAGPATIRRAPARGLRGATARCRPAEIQLLSSTSSMMPQGPRDPKSRAMIVALVLLAAVVLRGVFFLRFDESYFDSDQAIVGLMAKHLLEGRAFPLFFYGQEYMLGVESWVMAPVFAVFGPSVFALRLTMVLLNAVTTLTLVVAARARRTPAPVAGGAGGGPVRARAVHHRGAPGRSPGRQRRAVPVGARGVAAARQAAGPGCRDGRRVPPPGVLRLRPAGAVPGAVRRGARPIDAVDPPVGPDGVRVRRGVPGRQRAEASRRPDGAGLGRACRCRPGSTDQGNVDAVAGPRERAGRARCRRGFARL